MVLIRTHGPKPLRALLLALGLLAAAPAHAAHPLTTDDTGTLGGGAVEIELSALGQRPTSAPRAQLDFAVAVHVGIFDRLDAGASFGYELTYGTSAQYLLPPVFDLKLALWRGKTTSLALRADYTPPFSGALSSGGHDLGTLALLTWTPGALQLSFNGGVFVTQLCCPDHTSAALLGAVSASVTLRQLVFGGEAVAVSSPRGDSLRLAALLGAAYNFSANHWLSVGVGPLYERGGRVGVSATVGLTLSFSPARSI